MDQKKNIHVIVATGEWSQDALKYRRHRLAEYLRDHSDTTEVIWVCPSSKKEGMETLDNHIKAYYIQDLLPLKVFRFGRYFDMFYRFKLNVLSNYLNQKKNVNKFLWYTFPGFPYLSKITSWEKVIYDCSDLWTKSMWSNKNIVSYFREVSVKQSENRIIDFSDNIFCTSDYLYDYINNGRVLTKKSIHTLENGVDYEMFNQETNLPSEISDDNPVIGFIGGIKPKLDFLLLDEMMKNNVDWKLLLVGPDGTNGNEDFIKLTQNENVEWVGKVPPTEVPKYMKLVDIGILPYKKSVYNEAVFPLKLFEFLAAGKPVIGMNLPSTKKYSETNVYEYMDGESSKKIADSCHRLLLRQDEAKLIEYRKSIAKERDWQQIFRTMYDYVMEKGY